ncbi:hypothetical protein AB6G58_20710 [Providencia huaxiensis]
MISAINSSPYLAIVPEPWLENQSLKHTIYQTKLTDSLAIGNLFMMHRKSMQPWKKKLLRHLNPK